MPIQTGTARQHGLGNILPATNATVVVNNAITLNSNPGNSVSSITVNPGESISFQNSGSITTTNLINNGTIGMTTSLPSQSLTIASGGTFTNNGTFNSGTGTVNFSGSGTVSGTVGFYIVNISGGVDFGSSSSIIGNLVILAGGFVNNNPPSYGVESALEYNTNSTYGRGSEWKSTSGAGYPYDVQVDFGTTLNVGNTSNPAQCAGFLFVDQSATLNMNSLSSAISAGGDVINNGTLNLSSQNGGDIILGGNWQKGTGATFNPNGRAVIFDGSNLQSISADDGSESFDYLLNENSSGGIQLSSGTSVQVNGTSNGLQMLGTGTGNIIDLNGNALTLGSNVDIQNAGSGSITSALPASLNLTGTGNVNGSGTLSISSNITVNLNGGYDFGLTTLNGTLSINGGGFVNSVPPTYGTGSLLEYNGAGAPYMRGNEWNSASGTGYPYNVLVTNGTILDPAGTTFGATPLNCAGNLTIDNGSSLFLHYKAHNMTVPLIVSGSLTLNGSLSESQVFGGDIKVGGDWTNAGSFFLGGRAVFFDGTSGDQNLTGETEFDYLVIDNSSGNLNLNNNITIDQTLSLTNGLINTGTNQVAITSTGSVSRINGWVNGFLQKNVGTGSNVTRDFEIGDASNYTPVTNIVFGNVSGSGDLIASTTDGDHPQIGTSNINSSKSVNRYWTLTNEGIAFDNYGATFNFVPGDVDAGSNPNNFVVGKYDSPDWSYPTVGTRTSTSTQITGALSASDFQVGEQNCDPSLNASISGSTSTCDGGLANLTITISGGVGPYTVVYNDGSNHTLSSISSGYILNVSPSTTTTYSLVSVNDLNGCSGTISGSPATVTVHYSTSSSFDATSCDSYTLPWGDVVTSTGAYQHHYSTVFNCDSLVTANITIHNSASSSFDATSCDSVYAALGRPCHFNRCLPTSLLNGV